jgi:tRNA (adenine22-N1)-methyltransferase
MKLDSRLMAIADLVRKDKIFADIGTDHAYLPVYLVEKGIIKKAIAADLRVGPLENAKEAVVSYGYSDQIELRLSDGLDNFIENEVEEIAVAGMGGLLISSFVERTQWLKNENIHLILQPMTHVEELRKTLFDNGFVIDKEVVAKDGDKLYIILSVHFYEGQTAYTDLDLIVGKLPYNDDVLSKEYLNKIYDKYNKKLVALKKAEKECSDLEKLVEELKQWQK